jgi:hypothetical protein
MFKTVGIVYFEFVSDFDIGFSYSAATTPMHPGPIKTAESGAAEKL